MSKNTVMKAGGFQKVKLFNQISAELSKIAPKLGEERVYEALTCDEKMKEFAQDAIAMLPVHLKNQVNMEDIVTLILSNKKFLMKKKKNKEKVAKRIK